jgi:hypothetical protein
MKVIGLASTYGADTLAGADAVVEGFRQVRVSLNGTGKLAVEV